MAFSLLPAIIAKSIWVFLLSILGVLVTRILLSLGLAVVTFTGMNYAIDWLLQQGLNNLQGLPADVLGIMSTLKIGVCLSMYTSALAMRAALDFSPSDTLKRLIFVG